MFRSAVFALALLASTSAFIIAPMAARSSSVLKLSAEAASRRSFVESVAATGAVFAVTSLPAFADGAPAAAPAAPAEKVKYGDFPVPDTWGIGGKDYYSDAARVVAHMEYATQMEKGTPNMDLIGKNMKKEMVDFVSFYRRFNNISGKQSFSTLYTAINVLAGHYTSYGTKFPVPEKRRKRLYQEYAEIQKNIRKQR
mmetsp:Transcript_43620/g.88205  ORF Transcript_43620/g.88205 Transcript_43620/m.88205 type:complete len:197 (-) Transcript_43620:247-837(-)